MGRVFPTSVLQNLWSDVIEKCAVLSDCGKYRYSLSRSWEEGARSPAIFIMLNPSTADAERDDPTIGRCIGMGKRMGCVGIRVVNLFAFRATRPLDLKAADDPVGPDNFEHVLQAIERRNDHHGLMQGPVVCAWGTHGGFMGQDVTAMSWIASYKPTCLEITKHGFPRHPLYARSDFVLRPYPGRSSLPVPFEGG